MNKTPAPRPLDLNLSIMALNAEKTIERTLDSVDVHIGSVTLVDNGCTDNTRSIMQKWCESRKLPFTVHLNTPKARPEIYIKDLTSEHGINDGQSTGEPILWRWDTARNQLIETAPKDKKYTLVLDADDVYFEAQHIPSVLSAMDQGADVAYFRYEIMDNKSGRLSEVLMTPRLFNTKSYPAKVFWVGVMHETLQLPNAQVFAVQNRTFGFIRDMRDNDGGRTINLRNLKVLNYCRLNHPDLWHPRDYFSLAREAFNAGPLFNDIYSMVPEYVSAFLVEAKDANPQWKAQSLITLGQWYESNQQYHSATEAFVRALKFHDGIDTRLHLARVDFRLKRFDDCITNCNIGLDLAKTQTGSAQGHSETLVRASFIIYADALFQKKRFNECVLACHTGLRVAPGNKFLLQRAQSAFESMSDLDRQKLSSDTLDSVIGSPKPEKG